MLSALALIFILSGIFSLIFMIFADVKTGTELLCAVFTGCILSVSIATYSLVYIL